MSVDDILNQADSNNHFCKSVTRKYRFCISFKDFHEISVMFEKLHTLNIQKEKVKITCDCNYIMTLFVSFPFEGNEIKAKEFVQTLLDSNIRVRAGHD